MNKFVKLKDKMLDYAIFDVDLKSPRTKKAIKILGFNDKDLIRKTLKDFSSAKIPQAISSMRFKIYEKFFKCFIQNIQERIKQINETKRNLKGNILDKNYEYKAKLDLLQTEFKKNKIKQPEKSDIQNTYYQKRLEINKVDILQLKKDWDEILVQEIKGKDLQEKYHNKTNYILKQHQTEKSLVKQRFEQYNSHHLNVQEQRKDYLKNYQKQQSQHYNRCQEHFQKVENDRYTKSSVNFYQHTLQTSQRNLSIRQHDKNVFKKKIMIDQVYFFCIQENYQKNQQSSKISLIEKLLFLVLGSKNENVRSKLLNIKVMKVQSVSSRKIEAPLRKSEKILTDYNNLLMTQSVDYQNTNDALKCQIIYKKGIKQREQQEIQQKHDYFVEKQQKTTHKFQQQQKEKQQRLEASYIESMKKRDKNIENIKKKREQNLLLKIESNSLQKQNQKDIYQTKMIFQELNQQSLETKQKFTKMKLKCHLSEKKQFQEIVNQKNVKLHQDFHNQSLQLCKNFLKQSLYIQNNKQ